MFQNPRKRAFRRGWPIAGYVGPNGGGKSAGMVWDTLPTLDAGRMVLSTVRLLDYRNPRLCDDPACTHPEHAGVQLAVVGGDTVQLETEAGGPRNEDPLFAGRSSSGAGPADLTLTRAIPAPGQVTHMAAHPCYVPFTDWEQLLEAKDCDVLMDEVTGVASSRESQSMPAPVANKLVQLRRSDVVVRWSAPSWARADKIIRECSQSVTYCQGFFPKVTSDGETERQWRNRRLFRWKTYDAMDFEDFTAGKREQLSPWQVDAHWGPKSPAFAAYDTYDAVSVIGTVTDTGRCYRCGGRRSVPACKCPDNHAGPAEGGRGGGPRGAGSVATPSPAPGGGRRISGRN